jgi:hypothetical protein
VKTSDSDYRNAIAAIKVFAEANCAKQRFLILKEVISLGNLKGKKARFGIAI